MDSLDDYQQAEVDGRIGKVVDGRYKIIEPMASGSMGAVYKAEREPVGKIVAIKFLHSSFAKDSEFLTRFERETRVMSQLAHPNCVSVVDFGVWEGAPYLAMEYVSGRTLRTLLDDEGRLPPQRALLLTKQIVAGLAHAHAKGVTHRDVKPANIMISDEIGTGDHVRILDFGLARLRGNVGRDATQTNVVVGTPNYMAPEQTIGGGTIDARTDIYAAGVVLFEMIAGVRPFTAEDTLQLLGMHRAAPVPKLLDAMGEDSTALPEGIQELIEKAMAKLPDQRFQSAIEFSTAIEQVLGPRTSGAFDVPAVPSRRARTDPAAVAPTLVDVATGKVAPVRTRGASSKFPIVLMLTVLAGGAGAAVWYTKRSDTLAQPSTTVAAGSAKAVTDAAATAVADPGLVTIDAMAVVVDDLGSSSGSGSDSGSGAGSDAGAGSAAATEPEEIEMDPMAATNPDPTADQNEAADEAADAPETTEDVERLVPKAPVLATTVAQAVQMIKDGKRDLALSSLHALWKKSPNSAYIPFLLGNLYNDRLWWSVAVDHYKIAIKKNAAYKGNAVLNKNVIKMLGSPKTARKAELFLRGTISRRWALPYLKWAAKNEKHPNVRKAAARLAKSIR
ncbi:MAG: serine/threonine-protein kinase [Kofleriaceae bacterium]|nr:serine/threonine-protein kinase [Kofleriaceae bacterium]